MTLNAIKKFLFLSFIALCTIPHTSYCMYINLGPTGTKIRQMRQQQQQYLDNKQIVANKALNKEQLNTIDRQTINFLAKIYNTSTPIEWLQLDNSKAKTLINAINAEKTLQINDSITENLENALVQRTISYIPDTYKTIKQYKTNLEHANNALKISQTSFNILNQEKEQELYNDIIETTNKQAKIDPDIITSIENLDTATIKNITQKLITKTSANQKLLELYKSKQIWNYGPAKKYFSAINEYFDTDNKGYTPHGRYLGILLIYAILKNINLEKITLNEKEIEIYNNYLPEEIQTILKNTGKIVLFSEPEIITNNQSNIPQSETTTSDQASETKPTGFFSSLTAWYNYFMGKK